MVAAERNEMPDTSGLVFDCRHAFGDVAHRNREIADVGYGGGGGIDPTQRVIPIYQHPARLPYRRWSKSRAGPICRAKVERDSGNTDRRTGIIAGNTQKGRRHSESCNAGHDDGEPADLKRKTATATTQVQSPLGAP